jgi:hypothetical protein
MLEGSTTNDIDDFVIRNVVIYAVFIVTLKKTIFNYNMPIMPITLYEVTLTKLDQQLRRSNPTVVSM